DDDDDVADDDDIADDDDDVECPVFTPPPAIGSCMNGTSACPQGYRVTAYLEVPGMPGCPNAKEIITGECCSGIIPPQCVNGYTLNTATNLCECACGEGFKKDETGGVCSCVPKGPCDDVECAAGESKFYNGISCVCEEKTCAERECFNGYGLEAAGEDCSCECSGIVAADNSCQCSGMSCPAGQTLVLEGKVCTCKTGGGPGDGKDDRLCYRPALGECVNPDGKCPAGREVVGYQEIHCEDCSDSCKVGPVLGKCCEDEDEGCPSGTTANPGGDCICQKESSEAPGCFECAEPIPPVGCSGPAVTRANECQVSRKISGGGCPSGFRANSTLDYYECLNVQRRCIDTGGVVQDCDPVLINNIGGSSSTNEDDIDPCDSSGVDDPDPSNYVIRGCDAYPKCNYQLTSNQNV
ncbi:MAG: hypothetical protein ACOY3K_08200, partial [Candidatus Omnitrophota bacterium]